jgi:plasmid stability protein
MATLNIRRLPDDVHAKLRVRATKAGRTNIGDRRRRPDLCWEALTAKEADLAMLLWLPA